VKEGADDLRSSAEAAHGEADAVLQNFQFGRAQSRERMLFHPSPQPLARVQLGGARGQAIDVKAGSVVPQRGSGRLRAMGVQSVPEQKDRAGDGAEQVVDEGDELGAADRPSHQTESGVRVGRDGRDRRRLG